MRVAARQRGVTLLEVMIVMALIALMSAAFIGGSGQLAGSQLKRSATLVAGAVRVAFTRSTATSKSMRIVFDFEQNSLWLEEALQPMLVSRNDVTRTGGADPSTEAERTAVAEGERILKGPVAPRANFRAAPGFDDPAGNKGPRPLPGRIHFRSVHTLHDAEARTDGRAYLYFWPGGQTERSVVQLRIGDSNDDSDTLSLVIAPLTGKVTIKSGPVELDRDISDKAQSEREEIGGF